MPKQKQWYQKPAMTRADVALALGVDPSDLATVERFVERRALQQTWRGTEWEISTVDFMAVVMSAARATFSQPAGDAIAPEAPLMVKIAELTRLAKVSRHTMYRRLAEHHIQRDGKHGVMVDEFRHKWPQMYARLVSKSIHHPMCSECGGTMSASCRVCDFNFGF